MTPDAYHDFFVAAAGVAGALTGLLFVAVSVAPDRLLSLDAAQSNRVRAAAALTSFTNTLAVSLFALVPGIAIGWPAVVVAILGLMFVGGSLLSLRRERRERPGALTDAVHLVGLIVVFVLQLRYGARLIGDERNSGALDAIAILVIVCFLIGISRSWELIGGPEIGLLSELRRAASSRAERGD
jgi:hypothetical protein